MPEVVHTLGATKKPGSINDVRSSIHNRLQQLWIIQGVIFEIGILNQHNVAGCFRKSASQSGTFSLIRSLEEEPQVAQIEGVGSVLGSRCCLPLFLQSSHLL